MKKKQDKLRPTKELLGSMVPEHHTLKSFKNWLSAVEAVSREKNLSVTF